MQRVENQTKHQNFDEKQHYSLQADIVTGWKPRMKIIGPMPLNFDHPSLDKIIKPLIYSQSSPYQVIYLGLRPKDTFQMHSYLSKNYRYKFKHLLKSDYQHLKPFFKKFYCEFQPEYKNPFHGMNPNYRNHVSFQSRFQCGNLDCVVKIRNNQYDLFLRIDSNTCGHVMWYYFKVNNCENKSKVIRLNICNLRRRQVFYDNVLKYQSSVLNHMYIERDQDGNNKQGIRFYQQHLLFQNQELEQPKKYRKMSFDLVLSPNEQVQIAYSIPYTYSQLLEDIRYLKFKAQKNPQLVIDINMQNISLSGLQIPYIKIHKRNTNQHSNQQQTKKKQILIIARQHPGQSNSSHVLKGFLQQLVTTTKKKINDLFNYFNFHIIPMLNPDGVIIGNFRTSLYGKDLNRLFKKNQILMIPEIQFCRNVVSEMGKKGRKKLFMFLDFHGHSILRNAFCYAPSFFETNSLEDIRNFPKVISEISQIWRFPSCSFRIASHKKSTARAVFCQYFNLCYTIQISNWFYYSKQYKINIQFNQSLWQKFGRQFIQSLGQFFYNILQKRQERKKRNQATNDRNETKSTIKTKTNRKLHIQTDQIRQKIKNNTMLYLEHKKKNNHYFIHPTTNTTTNRSSIGNKSISSYTRSSKNNDDNLMEGNDVKSSKNIQYQQENNQNQQLLKQIIQEEDSDQSQTEDMQHEKFKKYIKIAAEMFTEFQRVYYRDDFIVRGRYQFPRRTTIKKKQYSILKKLYEKTHQYNYKNSHKTIPQSQKKINQSNPSQQKYHQLHKQIYHSNNQSTHNKTGSFKKFTKFNFVIPKQQKTYSLPKITISNYTIPLDQFDDKKIERMPKLDIKRNKKGKKQ